MNIGYRDDDRAAIIHMINAYYTSSAREQLRRIICGDHGCQPISGYITKLAIIHFDIGSIIHHRRTVHMRSFTKWRLIAPSLV